MQYYIFHRESDDFSDILKDVSLKNKIKHKVSWPNHMLIGLNKSDLGSYIGLKYGESIRHWNEIVHDYTPVAYKDYLPKSRESK